MELDRVGPDDEGGGINQFKPWVDHEILSDYSLKVVELHRISPHDVGCGINQFKPWVHVEFSSEYNLRSRIVQMTWMVVSNSLSHGLNIKLYLNTA